MSNDFAAIVHLKSSPPAVDGVAAQHHPQSSFMGTEFIVERHMQPDGSIREVLVIDGEDEGTSGSHFTSPYQRPVPMNLPPGLPYPPPPGMYRGPSPTTVANVSYGSMGQGMPLAHHETHTNFSTRRQWIAPEQLLDPSLNQPPLKRRKKDRYIPNNHDVRFCHYLGIDYTRCG
jgi:hypothetical protein